MTQWVIGPAKWEMLIIAFRYDSKMPGLGDAFLDEVGIVLGLIRRHPKLWRSMGNELYRLRLRRFPYGVLYALDRGEIVVLAIGHLRRGPLYWTRAKRRLR
jgi:toxin ParE1/3/4